MAGMMKQGKLEKAKDSKKALANLLNFCKKYWLGIVISLLLAGAGAVVTILGPDKLGQITNLIKNAIKQGTSIDMSAVLNITIILAILFLIGAICSFLESFIMSSVMQKISKNLRTQIDAKISKIPLEYFTSNSYGDILSRVTNDVDTISQSLSNSIGTIVSASVQFVGCIIMMFISNYIMSITAIVSTLLGMILMGVIMAKSQKYFIQRQQFLGEINGYIEEIYSGHDVIRVSHAEEKVKQKFDLLNSKVKSANYKSQFLSGLMQPLMNFVGNLGYVAVCVVGAILILNGSIELGTITAFMIYVRLFESPIKQIAQAMTNIQSTAAASERVFEFLGEKEMADESQKTLVLPQIKGNVVFENVKFAYPSSPDKEIIHNLCLNAKAGQKIAIVGPTGAGKTTIVNLLMRFFEITGGKISVDNINTQDMTRNQVHSLFSMVLQDTWLFEGTLRENLVFNMQNISDIQLDEVCKVCNLTHFVKSLPNGYDTVIGNNTEISVGQKQLITIARAMLQTSPMLILDEATSSIDTRTEMVVQMAMDKLTENRTSFVIAHRLSTIKNADLILVIKDGDIVEQGNHTELLNKNGFYAELYNSQFEGASA